MSYRLRLAVQKSGRLSDDCFDLIRQCGLRFRLSKTNLLCHCKDFPLDLLLVRDDDIPGLVIEGICDVGIVGENVLAEAKLEREITKQSNQFNLLKKLPFGRCRLDIAVPEELDYKTLQTLNNKTLATSYPRLLQQFLKKNKVKATVIELSGSVEIAPRLEIADAICDLVSSGATLEANGLRPVETILSSQAQLIANTKIPANKQDILNSLLNRLNGVLLAKESKYVMLHAPKSQLANVVGLLPGAEDPTIMPLRADNERVAIHAVCYESVFWETMEALKDVGASSILVLPIEKMME